MADHDERWLSYDDAIELLRDRFGLTSGQAQIRLQTAHVRGGVQVSPTPPRSRRSFCVAVDFPWEKAKYSSRDLKVWISQELKRFEAPAAASTGHAYRDAGDAELVARGVRSVFDEGLTRAEAARRLAPDDRTKSERIRKAIGTKLANSGDAKDSQRQTDTN
jgi:hypothetical protein